MPFDSSPWSPCLGTNLVPERIVRVRDEAGMNANLDVPLEDQELLLELRLWVEVMVASNKL